MILKEKKFVWYEFEQNRKIDENFYEFLRRTCICFSSHGWDKLHKHMFEEWIESNTIQFTKENFYNFPIRNYEIEMSMLKPVYSNYTPYVFKK